MQRRIIFVSSGIVSMVLLLVVLVYTTSNNTFVKDGITYALTLDGASTNSFPEKGLYQVDVNCTNARGKWDYDAWKLYIDNITGDVSCYIDFNTITKTYFNQKIMDLTGKNQGAGQVVNEKTKAINADASYSITEMTYTKSSGSEMQLVDGKYIGTATEQSSTKSKFTPKSDGFYKVCYSIPSSSDYGKNEINIYSINSTIPASTLMSIDSNFNNGAVVSGCYDYGYVTTNDFIYIGTYYYDQNITLWFEKTDNYSEVSAGIRYEGKDPNNYVWFNNELWRIIGVFDSASHGQSGQNLVKIIRAHSIGGLAWNKSGSNNWSKSSLYKLLNPVSGDTKSGAYYNAQDGTGGDYCYGYGTKAKSKCDYRYIGIQSNYRSMIKEVTWYLGGSRSYYVTTEAMYGYERGKDVDGTNPKTIIGYIGLMYPSDYGYAVPADNCVRTTKLQAYNNANCTLNNWLYGQGDELTITSWIHESYSTRVFFASGSVGYTEANIGSVVRPVLYLDSNTYVIDGDGSKADPYILGL